MCAFCITTNLEAFNAMQNTYGMLTNISLARQTHVAMYCSRLNKLSVPQCHERCAEKAARLSMLYFQTAGVTRHA